MKKNYIQPSVENTLLTMSSIVMAGSPVIGKGGNSSELGGEPLGD